MTSEREFFRADINGLRAIAVLAVVIFHLWPSYLPGGFTGVDVFFVISGYLITGTIRRDLAAGKFTFRNFYSRRVRRLAPALLTVMGATWILGLIGLLGPEFSALGEHLFYAGGFLANLKFWMEAGYFDVSADTKPLLHLWSLGIEEQFYLAWPLIFVVLIPSARKLAGTLVLVGVSFFINLLLVHTHPSAAFFLPMGRVWEFLIGAAVLWIPNSFFSTRTGFVPIGLGLIFLGFFLIRPLSEFPGTWALLPTVGTTFLIAAREDDRLGRFLDGGVSRYFGEISYPLYLWHWPILVFTRLFTASPLSAATNGIVLSASIFAATLTYRWIESPIRFGRRSIENDRRTILLLIGSLIFMIALGGITRLADGFPSRAPGTSAAYSERHAYRTKRVDPGCILPEDVKKDAFWCRVTGGSSISRAMIGDSHAMALVSGLASDSEGWITIAAPGCLPFPPVKPLNACDRSMAATIQTLSRSKKIKSVLIVVSESTYDFGSVGSARFTEIVGRAERALDEFRRSGKAVTLLVDNPHVTDRPENCGQNRPFERMGLRLRPKCTITRKEHRRAISGTLELIAALRKKEPAIRVFDPTDLLCDENVCPAMIEDRPLYSFGDHLSELGSARILPELTREIRDHPENR